MAGFLASVTGAADASAELLVTDSAGDPHCTANPRKLQQVD